jgi:hypothetical protein
MAKRLPIIAAIAGTLVLSALPAARAEEFSSCWVTGEVDAVGREQTVTRCRIAGGEVVDYASDRDVPSVLYPNVGTDLSGACWYYTSAATGYIILALYANGDADMAFNPDPSDPASIIILGDTLPRCTSEPAPAVDPSVIAWEYVTQYIHAPPAPDISPRPGDGLTGMQTHLGVPVPADHATQLSSAGTTLDVEIVVSAVVVEWGDGTRDTFPTEGASLTGYPNGTAVHVYETKDEALTVTVAYDWTARWRVVGGTWALLAVPNTATTVVYPVAEIVSVLTP